MSKRTLKRRYLRACRYEVKIRRHWPHRAWVYKGRTRGAVPSFTRAYGAYYRALWGDAMPPGRAPR